jgi:hypothetical protein
VFTPIKKFEVGVGLRGNAASFRERFQSVIDELEIAPLGVQHVDEFNRVGGIKVVTY